MDSRFVTAVEAIYEAAAPPFSEAELLGRMGRHAEKAIRLSIRLFLSVDEPVHREYRFALLSAVPVQEIRSNANERRDLCAALPAD